MRGLGAVLASPGEAADDLETRPLTRLVGGIRSEPSAVSWEHLVPAALDQGSTNSCVAHWFSMAIWLRGQIVGAPVPMPSRRWAYALARLSAAPGAPLVDEGCSARVMCESASTHGIVAESRFPFDPTKPNELPPFDADVAGSDALFTGWYRAGTDPGELRTAIAAGHVPGFALAVYSNFGYWDGSKVYEASGGDFLGYHMLTLIGYRPGKDGLEFRVLNSWGPSWGDKGCTWMSSRVLGSLLVTDRYVVTSAPVSR